MSAVAEACETADTIPGPAVGMYMVTSLDHDWGFETVYQSGIVEKRAAIEIVREAIEGDRANGIECEFRVVRCVGVAYTEDGEIRGDDG